MKTLAIFDFDDTLFKSGCRVIVRSNSGEVKYLTTHEYATYVANDKDVLDFSEFERYPPNPKPIKSVIDKLKFFVNSIGIENIIILTARADEKPIVEVLKNFNLPPIKIVAIASSNPEAKASFIEMMLKIFDYQKIVLFEDSNKNIDAIKKVALKKLRPEMIWAYRVTANDTNEIIEKI